MNHMCISDIEPVIYNLINMVKWFAFPTVLTYVVALI